MTGSNEQAASSDAASLKKAKDDAVAANIKLLENLYSFLIGFALTQATMKLADIWISSANNSVPIGETSLYAFLLLTIVPFYQGMNRFLYVTHVVRPLEKPGFKSSPLLLDIYVFILMGCLFFSMGRFLDDPTTFFYLWSALLVIDIVWCLIVWAVQKGRRPIWAFNNFCWLTLAWLFHLGYTNVCSTPDCCSSIAEWLPYHFVLFGTGRTIADYIVNWKFYFPPEYKGF